jgi:hypothetical protein
MRPLRFRDDIDLIAIITITMTEMSLDMLRHPRHMPRAPPSSLNHHIFPLDRI